MSRALEIARQQRDEAKRQRDEAKHELDDRNRQINALTALVCAPVRKLEAVNG